MEGGYLNRNNRGKGSTHRANKTPNVESLLWTPSLRALPFQRDNAINFAFSMFFSFQISHSLSQQTSSLILCFPYITLYIYWGFSFKIWEDRYSSHIPDCKSWRRTQKYPRPSVTPRASSKWEIPPLTLLSRWEQWVSPRPPKVGLIGDLGSGGTCNLNLIWLNVELSMEN